MKILLLSDLHGKFKQYNDIVNSTEYPTIVLGIEGLGFNDRLDAEFKPNKKDKFFRGNHSDPAKCKAHPNYMGDYGYDEKTGIFHIAGAYSIDKAWRTPMINWWPDEQIPRSEWNNIKKLYKETKPNIMLSHTLPYSMITPIFEGHFKPMQDDTTMLLDMLLEIHKPKLYVFGHMHRSAQKKINGTQWVSLDELETLEICTEDWR